MSLKGKFKFFAAAAAVSALAVLAPSGGNDALPEPPPSPASFLIPEFCAEDDPNIREVSAITLENMPQEKPPCIPLPDDGRMKIRPIPPATQTPMTAPRTLEA